MRNSILLAMALTLSALGSLSAQDQVIVRPREIDSILVNPGIGFNTSQHVDTRPGPDGRYPYHDPQLSFDEYPQTTLAYLRFEWAVFEPEEGRYNWYIIDDAIKLAVERGQLLAFRVVPYNSGEHDDIPGWLRAKIGPSGQLPHEYWRVTHSEPEYIAAITRLAAALGRRYDGHPEIEFVDAGIVGFWGEGAGSELLPQATRERLVDAYLDAFHKTPVVMLLTDERTNRYAISRGNPGWRVDCLGDLGFWAKDQNGWTHMFDYYPQSIIKFGVKDAWKTAPVVLEICGVFRTWDRQQGYDSLQVAYNLEQSLKWHVSTFNAKSGAVPLKWRGMVDEWLKKMGYRFVLRKFNYPREVRPQGRLAFTSWWENKGVAPCYRPWPLALRLKGPQRTEVLLTDADIRQWMPGDNLFDSAVFIPADLPAGEYRLQLGIVDPRTRRPRVKLAIEGRDCEGWYDLGAVTVKK